MSEGFVLRSAGLIVQLSDILRKSVTSRYRSLERNYGSIAASLVSLCMPDTAAQYERIQDIISDGTDEDTLALRQAVTDECNLTAVAVGG